MSGVPAFDLACLAWIALALPVHLALFRVNVPFGRHVDPRWGPVIDNRLGWMLMELPSWAIMLGFLVFGPQSRDALLWLPFGLWLLHYTNRCFVFPLRMRANPRGMPVAVAASGFAFNCVNAGLNGWFLATLADPARYGMVWLGDWLTWCGLGLFTAGWIINVVSDSMLISLRKPGETGYRLPRGFLFNYVAAPNLLGEIVEWVGFALAVRSLPALAFAVWTYANLVPRASRHWEWSRRAFPDYPAGRRRLVPFLW